jgi:hypothetical protein
MADADVREIGVEEMCRDGGGASRDILAVLVRFESERW